MADIPLWVKILEHIAPILIPLVVRLMGKILPFTALTLRLSPPINLENYHSTFLLYTIRVKNTGRKTAENCWPQLASYPAELDLAFTSQPMPWIYDIGEETSAQFTMRPIQPKEEVEFILIFTSELDSKNGVCLADIPTARRYDQHRLAGLPSGIHTIKVNVIGDNVYAKAITLRVTLADLGVRSWRTLKVERWGRRQAIMHKVREILGAK